MEFHFHDDECAIGYHFQQNNASPEFSVDGNDSTGSYSDIANFWNASPSQGFQHNSNAFEMLISVGSIKKLSLYQLEMESISSGLSLL